MKKLFILFLLFGFTSFCYAQERSRYYVNPQMRIYAYYNCTQNTIEETEDFIHEMNQFKTRTIMYYCFKDKPKEEIKETERTKILKELQNKNPLVRIMYSVYMTANSDTHFVMYMSLFNPSTGKPFALYKKGVDTEYEWEEEPIPEIDIYEWEQRQK